MAKTTTAGMDTHLLSEVTTLSMATIIERTDGIKFRLTTSSEDLLMDIGDGDGEQTYSASEGVSRTNIESDAELNVDNLDIVGVFDNVLLKETELRRGLFDFAEFRIFVFNHQDNSDGIIKIFRGQLGEVITTKQNFFQVQVRSIVQVYSKQTGEQYSKDCRADLGDIRCTVPIFPNVVGRNQSLTVGDFYLASSSLESIAAPALAVHGDNTAEDTSANNAIPTVGAQASFNTAVTQFGPASLEFTPSGAVDPSTSFISYPNIGAYSLGGNEFTIEGWVRFKDLTSSLQIIASKYLNTGNQREWRLERSAGNFQFVFSTNGTDGVVISGAFTFLIDTYYHVAVTRDGSDDFRLFVGGTQVGSTTNNTSSIFSGTAVMRLGKFRSAGFDDSPMNGFIEDFRFIVGTALYTANFTPPARFQSVSEVVSGLIWEDFDDRLYEVTVAGTTDIAIQPAYDIIIDNTTVDGTATLTARNSWTRFAQVTAVSGSDPRRIFTVVDLTPNSGQVVGTNRVPSVLGFPDDWFNGGGCLFETGNNAGRAIEVRDFIADDGITITQDIELFQDLPFDIVIGDKLRIFPGCDKTNAVCISKFNNGRRFVGEPYVPGNDIMGQYPDAR